MLCNKRTGSPVPCFVRSLFGDEALILVIKRSFGTSEMDSFLFRGSASKVLKKVFISHYILLDTFLALRGKCVISRVQQVLISSIINNLTKELRE